MFKRLEWNPAGSGLATQDLRFPIMLLDNTMAPVALPKAAHNQQHVQPLLAGPALKIIEF